MPGTHSTARSGNHEGVEADNGYDEDDDLAEDEETLDPELEALLGLAQMDAEAAAAYEIVADYGVPPAMRQRLIEFAKEHERHVNEIGEFLIEQGVEPDIALPDPDASCCANLTNALAALGGRSALAMLRATELFTNAAYAAVLEVVVDPDAFVILQRNFADEQRHQRWLGEHHDADWETVGGEDRLHSS
jgi:hypothetical protein